MKDFLKIDPSPQGLTAKYWHKASSKYAIDFAWIGFERILYFNFPWTCLELNSNATLPQLDLNFNWTTQFRPELNESSTYTGFKWLEPDSTQTQSELCSNWT